jgi:GDPmannose 4,6-dehydratase
VPNALITGITGQDGGYLAEQLVADGYLVHGAMRAAEEVPGHLAALGGAVVLHEVDLLDEKALAQLVAVADPDETYNLVGVSSVALSWQEPRLTAQVNGLVVAQLLERLWQHQEERGRPLRLVQASSAEIFAGAGQVPQSEETPLYPRSPYGASKAYAHQLVQVYRGRGLHASNVILYNHESPRRPRAFVTRKITQAVAAIAEGTATELVLGNLDARRDWGWAPEYVAAMSLALRHPDPQDFVIATGTSRRVGDFVAAAFARVGIVDWQRYVRSDAAFARPADAAELVGDATRARELLGWQARTPFEEIVGRLVDADRERLAHPGA